MTAGPQAGMLLDDPYFPYTAGWAIFPPLLKQLILREGGLSSISSTHKDDHTTASSSYHLQPHPPESYLMARKHTVQRPSLASLVFLAGAASGTFLTLSNFQSLTSSVSVQCLYAYNLPIRGCSLSDFTGGASCSESCIAGLQAVQFSVRGLCANVNSASNSLLLQVKEGHILDVLCKTDTPQMSITSTPTSTPTPPPKQTPPPPQKSSESEKITSAASTTSDRTSTTSSATSKAATSAIPTLTSVVIPSSASESTTEATNAATSQATNDEQPTSTSEEKPKPTRRPNTQPGSGGGSPFDFVASSKATKFGLSRASITMAIAITFTTLTLI